MSLDVILLAAGKGTRMKSELPKVLHPVAGRPMLRRVVDAARGAGAGRLVAVVSGDVERLAAALGAPDDLAFAIQAEQLGTGHAVLAAREAVTGSGAEKVLIINGDLPRLRAETLREFLTLWEVSGAEAAILTTRVPDPHGYGRIVRDEAGAFAAIVEHRDADEATRAIDEINVGIYGAPAAKLFAAIDRAGNDNDQGEYYLTDAFALLLEEGLGVEAFAMDPHQEFEGVNNRVQLAEAAAWVYRRNAEALMMAGVTMTDPASTYIDEGVTVGGDSVLGPGVVLAGETTVGAGVTIGAYAVIRDSQIADGVTVNPHSVFEGAKVGEAATIGPFARLREGSDIGPKARVGNFVETKKAKLAEGAKASHLAYLGDCAIGAGSNVGAGTITCNYDGFAKHFTELGAGVFVGSNSTLVAPLTLGEGTFVAAGSTVTKDSGKDDLVIGRARQTAKAGYAARLRARLGKKDS